MGGIKAIDGLSKLSKEDFVGLDDNPAILAWYVVIFILYDGLGFLLITLAILLTIPVSKSSHIAFVTLSGIATVFLTANFSIGEGPQAQPLTVRIVPLTLFIISYVGLLLLGCISARSPSKGARLQ